MNVGLVQINESFSGQNYLPYSIGLMQSYAEKYYIGKESLNFKKMIYKRTSINEIISKIYDSNVVGFSIYIWNERISLKIAKELKKINPHCIIVFGGPQVPDNSEEFLNKNKFIDIAVCGEGEHTFTEILNKMETRKFNNILSTSYLEKDGTYIRNERMTRIKELDIIPSPYIEGVFDKLIQENIDEKWLAMWETNRGCPFSCCISNNNYIALADKIIKLDEEIYSDQLMCSDESHNHKKCLSDKRIVYQGKENCLLIKMSNGSFIELTNKHKVKIVNKTKDGFVDVEAENIKIGDYLPLEIGQNSVARYQAIPKLSMNYEDGIGNRNPKKIKLPKYLTEDLAWLLGYIIGDGCLSVGKPDKHGNSCIRPSLHIVITNKYEKKLLRLFNELFGLTLKLYKANSTTKMKHGWIDSRLLVRFLNESIGIGIKKDKLKIPRLLFKSPKDVCESFLNGLWDADGYIQKAGPKYLTTISNTLAQEVYCLLHWIGYPSILREIKYHGVFNKKNRKYIYRIEWQTKNNLLYNKIPANYKIYKDNNNILKSRASNREFVHRNNLITYNPDHALLIDNIYYTQVKNITITEKKDIYDIGNPPTYMLAINGIYCFNSFCDWGSAVTAKVNQFSLERLYKEVDWFAKNKIEFIYSCDANFGILQRDLDIVKYVAKVKKEIGYPHALSVQNTKNSTEKAYQVQKILSDAGLNKGVTLSVQSMDKTTLRNVRRANISLESFKELQRRFAKDSIETYSDMIIGLPGETYDSFVNGIDEVIYGGQHNRIQFGNLSLLPNTEMSNKEYRQKYGIKHIESKIINMHGSLSDVEEEEIQEMQELVTSTNSMPVDDWIKTRAYCWMVSLLYFNKLLQIPIAVMYSLAKFKHREVFESFMNINDKENFPIIFEIKKYFINKAIDVQSGGEEHIQSKEWLNIWWPPDEYILIKLVKENKIKEFYLECELMLNNILSKKYNFSPKILHECIKLNYSLLRIPFDSTPLEISLSYNIYEYYKNLLCGILIDFTESNFKYKIDRSNLNNINTWNDWYKYVIWYGNKKGAYLHKNLEIINK